MCRRSICLLLCMVAFISFTSTSCKKKKKTVPQTHVSKDASDTSSITDDTSSVTDDVTPVSVDDSIVNSEPVAQGCRRDIDCEKGSVCDVYEVQYFDGNPVLGACVSATGCKSNKDCEKCGPLATDKADCGFGGYYNAWCDLKRGNEEGSGICLRELGPCEKCETDEQCGFNAENRSVANKCAKNEKTGDAFCQINCKGGLNCPKGFGCVNDVCVSQTGKTCEDIANMHFCNSDTNCDQPGKECCYEHGEYCINNKDPGSVGICWPICKSDHDCTGKEVCKEKTGACILGCEKGTCASQKVCHIDGECADKCASNEANIDNKGLITITSTSVVNKCVNADGTGCLNECQKKYGTEFTVCNIPGTSGFKADEDNYSCVQQGCRENSDCQSRQYCDTTHKPNSCKDGCITASDCKSREECCDAIDPLTLECVRTDKTKPAQCIYPGCKNRTLDCAENQFCCGEVGSPYDDTSKCPVGVIIGDCFDAPNPPWCVLNCENNDSCEVRAGETGLCFQTMAGNICGVGCKMNDDSKGCPRNWFCTPYAFPCMQTSDCTVPGSECKDADVTNQIPGYCTCVPNQIGCPDGSRCESFSFMVDGEMKTINKCIMAYNCSPPMSCFEP